MHAVNVAIKMKLMIPNKYMNLSCFFEGLKI